MSERPLPPFILGFNYAWPGGWPCRRCLGGLSEEGKTDTLTGETIAYGESFYNRSWAEPQVADIASFDIHFLRVFATFDAGSTWTFDRRGLCDGLAPNSIDIMRDFLDLCYGYNIFVILVIANFRLLTGKFKNGGQDAAAHWDDGTFVTARPEIATQTANRQAWLDNGVTPYIEALRTHPAILAWEGFNEPRVTGVAYDESVRPTDANVIDLLNDLGACMRTADGGSHEVYSTGINGETNLSWVDNNVTGDGILAYHYNDLTAFGTDNESTVSELQAGGVSANKSILLCEAPASIALKVDENIQWAYDSGFAGILPWSIHLNGLTADGFSWGDDMRTLTSKSAGADASALQFVREFQAQNDVARLQNPWPRNRHTRRRRLRTLVMS